MKLLSPELHQRLLGVDPSVPQGFKRQSLEYSLEHRIGKKEDKTETVELPLKAWMGSASEMLKEASSLHLGYLNSLKATLERQVVELPMLDFPEEPGWYTWVGKWVEVEHPGDNLSLCLDFETIPEHPLDTVWKPFMAVAYSFTDSQWYFWHPDWENMASVVPFGRGNLVQGWNIPYDRKYLASEYPWKDSGNRFWDGMGAHIAVRGMCNQQRSAYAKMRKPGEPRAKWFYETCTNGLDNCYEYYTGQAISKDTRESFVKVAKDARKALEEGKKPPLLALDYVKANFQHIARYCYTDVLATIRTNQKIIPQWFSAFPSEVSQAASLLLGSFWVPHSKERFPEFHTEVEQKYQETLGAIAKDLADEATRVWDGTPDYPLDLLKYLNSRKATDEEKAKAFQAWLDASVTDAQLKTLDWYPLLTGANKGLPRWYKEYIADPKVSKRTTALLLGFRYGGQKVYWHQETSRKGWWITEDGKGIPHPEDSEEYCPNLFVKGHDKLTESGFISSENPVAQGLLARLMTLVNWTSIRERIGSIKWEWSEGVPVVLPEIVPTGTITRRCADRIYQVMANPKPLRIGTEFKATIEAPKGYRFVGADVDQQELWLAAILGDLLQGYLGYTPLSRLVIIGSKADRTDPHSVLADTIGIHREAAKIIWYSLIYGSGLSGLIDFLTRVGVKDPEKTAREIMETAKGTWFKGSLSGGLASETFNKIKELASVKCPRTPVLKAKMSSSLAGFDDFATTRGNWVVQSSGVDFRDIMVVLMHYFIAKGALDARLCLTIHDELRYLVREDQAIELAYYLQIAHLYTRAIISDSLGLECLPVSTSWFSEVDIDTVLRKDPTAPCTTLSSTEPIAPGYSLTPKDLLERLC